jgi:hypothetical protein
MPLKCFTDPKGTWLDNPSIYICSGREPEAGPPDMFSVEWMHCSNSECKELIIRLVEWDYEGSVSTFVRFLVPQHRQVSIDPLIPPNLAKDYTEAWTILNASPRMSAVLSRKILSDLLKDYAGLTQHNLLNQIDKFVEDKSTPIRIIKNLHFLREMGNFGAHTMTDGAGNIIACTPEEAEWTLKVVGDLFDHFIVRTKKDEQLRNAFNLKLQQAGRKTLKI